MQAAMDMHVDDSALNCANEPQTIKQIPLAYQIAEKIDFKVPSFS